jgi:hypothetical protein
MGLCCNKPDVETRRFTPIKITKDRLTPYVGPNPPPTPRLSRSLTFTQPLPGTSPIISFSLPPPMDFLSPVYEDDDSYLEYLQAYSRNARMAAIKGYKMDKEMEKTFENDNKWITRV